jgi:V8-like Glu-specific endopeptidase
MKKRFGVVLLVVILTLSFVGSALAITHGEPDGDDHPHVGILNFFDGEYWYVCSGTLIAPDVVLTAGHCTHEVLFGYFTNSENPFGADWIFYDEMYTMDGYADGPWFMYDAGIVILSEPIFLDEYGVLPELDSLDAMKTARGRQNTTFDAVGYGMTRSFPVAASWKDEAYYQRQVSHPELIQINVPGFVGDFSLLLTNNANTGGTCFGDSGGPIFLEGTNVIAAITSFGINSTCAGTGGVFRTDRANVLSFIEGHLP